jgi:transposase
MRFISKQKEFTVEEKKRRKNRSYTEEFRKEAIELAKRIGNTKAGLDLGVNEGLIRQWRIKYKLQEGLSDNKSYNDLEKENRRLQKEIGYLKEINEVLKKSTAILSQEFMEKIK